jgi:hypothetical protein
MDSKNKRIFFAFLLLLGLALPLFQAKAFVGALASLIVAYLLAGISTFVLKLSQLFLSLCVWFFTTVQSPGFINWSFTGPDNPIVSTGWMLTRDLMNMLFVIVLVFIGLATALKLEQYRYQKMLPTIVLIALTMNFTPVICGVFIDASNIITNFFLGQSSGAELLQQVTASQMTQILNAFGAKYFDPIDKFQRAFQGFIMSGFNIWAGLTYGLYGFLFMGRYIALWLLVILSPLAFFSYILPETRTFWTKWWGWFFQWCFVGITAGFFVYLSNLMLLEADKMVQTAGLNLPAGMDTFWLGFLHILLPYAAATAFMALGLILALNSSAEGAKYAVTAAQKTGGAAASFVGRQVKEKVRSSDVLRRFGEKAATARRLGELTHEEEALGLRKWTRPKIWGKTAVRWATTPITSGIRAIGAPLTGEARSREIEQTKERAKKVRTKEILVKDFILGGKTQAEKVAGLQTAIDKGWHNDIMKIVGEDEIKKIGRWALQISPEDFKPIRDTFPQLAAEMGKGLSESVRKAGGLVLNTQDLQKYGNLFGKIVATASPKQIEKWDDKILLHPEALKMFYKHGSGREIGAAAKHLGSGYVDKFMSGAKRLGHNWFETNNPKVLRYLRGSAAQNLGFEDLRPSVGGTAAPTTPTPPPTTPTPPPTTPTTRRSPRGRRTTTKPSTARRWRTRRTKKGRRGP